MTTITKTPGMLAAHGVIPVPPGTDTRDFAEMEFLYRGKLWPAPWPGMARWRRELCWKKFKTELHFQIFDVPAHGEANG